MRTSPTLSIVSLLAATASAGYAPVSVECPTAPLVRRARGLSDEEEAYRVGRKAVADVGLKAWLEKTNAGFGTEGELPAIGLTSSGGGYRALLCGAGVIQGLDERDSDVGTSGLYQALTYQTGLSGGAWMLSSFAGNNYPRISELRDNLWGPAFQEGLLDPDGALSATAYAAITADIAEKTAAGYVTTLTDVWGRLLAYQLLDGADGGVATTLSGLAAGPNFTALDVPYPIMTSLGVKTWDGECLPGPNATTYEFAPFEFGSWDADVGAFVETRYLGTTFNHGKPVHENQCTENFDNLGLVLGTSSSLFSELCGPIPPVSNTTTNTTTPSLTDVLVGVLDSVHAVTTADEYASYPNPFHHHRALIPNPANPVPAQPTLSLVDGGLALQNNPIFPLLQPARNLSVLLVSDNSADTTAHWPNGSEILTTYVQWQNQKSPGHPNLTARMPLIPSVDTFLAQGYNTRATFFGCDDPAAVTIIYLPNAFYTAPSNTSTEQLSYPIPQTDAIIANGVQIAAQGGDSCWPTCLGCGIMKKSGQSLPDECNDCFAKYCYYGDGS